MKKIFLASCGMLMLILPAVSFGKDLKWSGVLYLKGTGATNCGKTRITNEAWDRCEDWASKSIKGNEKPNVEDVELYNIAVENDKGPSWNPKLNCNFRASVKCGYSMEKISAEQKLDLSRKNKLKKLADAESCGEAEAQKAKADDCEVGMKKDKAADKPALQPDKHPASSTPEVVGTPPLLLIKPEVQLALSQAGVGGMPQGGSDAGKQDEAAMNKRIGAVVSALKNEIKWSGKLSLKGKGITNCGESYISGEAWEICEAWAEKKKGQKGFAVKPEVRDIKVSDVNVTTSKPVANDPNPSCAFEAKVKCGYSTAVSVVEHSAGTMQHGKADGHDLNDLFGDGLRWSGLLSIEGSGITNCGKPRIRNEAWDKCEAWAEMEKQKGGRRPTVKKVELYNVASEIEKGPSWDPTKQNCVYHATLKCGYKIE